MLKFAVKKARCYPKDSNYWCNIHTSSRNHSKKYDDLGHYAIARDIRRKFLKDRETFSVTQETSADFNSYKSIALQCTLTDTLMKLYVLSLQTPLVHAAEGHVWTSFIFIKHSNLQSQTPKTSMSYCRIGQYMLTLFIGNNSLVIQTTVSLDFEE